MKIVVHFLGGRVEARVRLLVPGAGIGHVRIVRPVLWLQITSFNEIKTETSFRSIASQYPNNTDEYLGSGKLKDLNDISAKDFCELALLVGRNNEEYVYQISHLRNDDDVLETF